MVIMATIPKEMYYQEYSKTYAPLKVENKTVVDIGAGAQVLGGSSVDWFLEHGALYVWAFEADPDYLALLHESFDYNPRVAIHGKWTGRPIVADILKVDCEGCESMLDLEYIRSFGQFAIGVHSEWMPEGVGKKLIAFLKSLGAVDVFGDEPSMERMYVKTV
jgi:hypothetical protein